MLSVLLRGRELAWTIAGVGLGRTWTSALAALVELTGSQSQAAAPARSQRTVIADADLKLRVGAALGDDESLRSSTIVVASVYDGLVVVAGLVPSLATHRRAFEIAASIIGVRRVMSTIDVTPAEAVPEGREFVDQPIVADAIAARRAAGDAPEILSARSARRRRAPARARTQRGR